MRVLLIVLALLAAVGLGGCAGTVQRDAGSANGHFKLVGASYSTLELVMTDQARRLQVDNPQFNVQELAGYLQRRLDGNGLLKSDAAYKVNVTIDEFRVRSAVSAVIFGVMAGTDSIDGHVQVQDARGKTLHSFKISASYGLGGWGGGQDGTRMTWLYDKFSELTVSELMGATSATNVSKTKAPSRLAAPATPIVISADSPHPQLGPKVAIVGASAQPRALANQPVQISSTASGFASIDDVDAIPYLGDKGRAAYRDWLTKATPRAFALSTNGYFWHSWGLKPADATLPTDPSERVLISCEKAAKQPCKLYAVNGAVVWVKESVAPTVSSASTIAPVAQ